VSEDNINKFITALKNLNIKDWSLTGEDPTNETEFLARFNKCIGVGENLNAIMSNDPSKFGVTWTQIKTEIDKL